MANEDRVDLVFQGGGVKGIALVGAYSVLEERGFRPQNIAGTSAGAIVATLAAAGYTSAELHDILASLEFSQFLDRALEDRIPIAGALISVLKDQGIFEGNVFLGWLHGLLQAKGKTKFGDLVIPEFADDPQYRHKVQVIASDVTHRRMLVLPRDAVSLGIEPDDLDIALAVRMSMSIPIFFEPVRRAGPDGEHVIVDGGMLSNFPVWLFDSSGVPEWPTFGLKLVDPKPKEPLTGGQVAPVGKGPIRETIDHIAGLVSTMTDAHDKLYLEKSDFVRTITISNLGVRTMEFSLSPERAEELFREGRRAAKEFLEKWNFDAYVELFRKDKEQPSRRETVGVELRRAEQEAEATTR
jgi:NTE family protein